MTVWDNQKDYVSQTLKKEKWIKCKGIEYLNTPIAYDIETTSWLDNGEKRGIMYIWTMAVRDQIIQGRTWDSFISLLSLITQELHLDLEHRIIIYVHNLGFEFQFMRRFIQWEKVFSIREREPLYALATGGIEFRCSYKLTNYSLDTVASHLKSGIQKLKGDLDYSLIRHSDTPLTDKELAYTYNDVLIITEMISEKIEESGNIGKIPLTSTGYVRRLCRRKTDTLKYQKLVRRCVLNEDIYYLLKAAFQGGYVHANAKYSGKTLNDVGSHDETSAYPAALCREKYPIGAGEAIDIHTHQEIKANMNYACLLALRFEGIRAKDSHNEHPLSLSKCICTHPVIDNGRIASADELQTVITEQDYIILSIYYDWDKMEILKCYRWKKDYLPRELILAILELYATKTQLKGVKDKEEEYQHSKELLNAVYGMMVTSICRPIYGYEDNGWLPTVAPDIKGELERYNKSRGRFLYYPWGVWCTAYARTALFSAILALGDDYVYSDTDSAKYLHPERHKEWFERANEINRAKLLEMCKARNIDPNLIEPVTVYGKKKLLGAWEYEGKYDVYKTLGAKRYIVKEGDKYKLTVSGVSKDDTMKWLVKEYKTTEGIMKAFDKSLVVPAEATGKNTHTYIDDPACGQITDYLGTTVDYAVPSCVHLEGAAYSLSLSQAYIDFLNRYKIIKLVEGV